MPFKRKKKKDRVKGNFASHIQTLSELAEHNLYALIKKEKIKQPTKNIGKNYMINKLLEEL